MNPEEYEHHVAAVLQSEGWETTVTRRSRDMGVDVFAARGTRRMAVQAKMYGATSTKVNAEQIMFLYGAGTYAECTDHMLATDGRLTAEAEAVADKLGVVVRHIAAHGGRGVAQPGTFSALWRDHIEPLAGTALARSNGKTMRILTVDGSGVRRITTGGTQQRIAIDTFRWAVDRLLAGETVTRAEIHQRNPRQVSSGVMLILGTVPYIHTVTNGKSTGLRMNHAAFIPR